MQKPQLITFTGLDFHTNLDRAEDLSHRYPIEWGVLFSRSRSGADPRYPTREQIERFLIRGMRMSAHLCGEYARRALYDDSRLLEELRGFGRVQINYAPDPRQWLGLRRDPNVTLGFWEAERFADRVGRPVILQSRSTRGWPDLSALHPVGREYIHFLYDLSGGRGKAPAKWPRHPGGTKLHGYAGGINPDNVAKVVQAIGSDDPYWLDMEGGVRTAEDRMDLDKVEAVCRAVYD